MRAVRSGEGREKAWRGYNESERRTREQCRVFPLPAEAGRGKTRSFPKPDRRALLSGHIDHREAGCGQPLRAAVFLLRNLEPHVAGAKLHRPAPGEPPATAFEGL